MRKSNKSSDLWILSSLTIVRKRFFIVEKTTLFATHRFSFWGLSKLWDKKILTHFLSQCKLFVIVLDRMGLIPHFMNYFNSPTKNQNAKYHDTSSIQTLLLSVNQSIDLYYNLFFFFIFFSCKVNNPVACSEKFRICAW